MPSSLVKSQKAGRGDQEAGDEVDHRLPQSAAAGLAFGMRRPRTASMKHKVQLRMKPSVVISAALATTPALTQTRGGQSPRAAPEGVPHGGESRRCPLPAAPRPHKRQSHCHHPGHEVRAHAGITGGAGDLRRTKGHHRRQHTSAASAERNRQLRAPPRSSFDRPELVSRAGSDHAGLDHGRAQAGECRCRQSPRSPCRPCRRASSCSFPAPRPTPWSWWP
jgi:hypothetical protein